MCETSSNRPIDLNEQVTLMKNYVHFRRKEKVERFLKYTGYFRASRYGKFLLSHSTQLGGKSSHYLLFNLYSLDVQLRKLFFEYCKYAEIHLRTIISDTISLVSSDACFYLKTENYTPSKSETDANKRRRNQRFFNTKFYQSICDLEHEIRTNPNKYPELTEYRKGGIRDSQNLPCWLYFYYVEFGNVCLIYEYLRMDYKKKVLDKNYEDKRHSKKDAEQFITWIQAIKNLRNVCCHHNILVGKTSSIVLEDASDHVLLKDTDLFSRLYALKKVLPQNLGNKLKKDLKKILSVSNVEYPTLDILPADWESRFDNINEL